MRNSQWAEKWIFYRHFVLQYTILTQVAANGLPELKAEFYLKFQLTDFISINTVVTTTNVILL